MNLRERTPEARQAYLDGYRAGVEAAARIADERGEGIGNVGDQIRALAPSAPRPYVCPLCGSEWQLRYEGGASIGFCPKCLPDEEAKRVAARSLATAPARGVGDDGNWKPVHPATGHRRGSAPPCACGHFHGADADGEDAGCLDGRCPCVEWRVPRVKDSP